eukprot:sb/3468337/
MLTKISAFHLASFKLILNCITFDFNFGNGKHCPCHCHKLKPCQANALTTVLALRERSENWVRPMLKTGQPLPLTANALTEPTEINKQPFKNRYLGHVVGYQPIREQYFLLQLPEIAEMLLCLKCRTSKQSIRTPNLGHVTSYQPIMDQCFLIRSVPVISPFPTPLTPSENQMGYAADKQKITEKLKSTFESSRSWRHSHLVRSPRSGDHTRCLCHQLLEVVAISNKHTELGDDDQLKRRSVLIVLFINLSHHHLLKTTVCGTF